MSDIRVIILAAGLIFSFICSGSETGMYQLSRLRLRLGVEQKSLWHRLLAALMARSNELLISILIGNNLSNYAVTSILTTYFLAVLPGSQSAELAVTVVAAPLLFIFCEVLPKNIFFFRADVLMPGISPVIYIWHKLMTYSLVSPIIGKVASLLSRLYGPAMTGQSLGQAQRHHLLSILQETREEGFLSPVQRHMLERLANIANISAAAVMVPLTQTVKADVQSTRAELTEQLKETPFTRVLVYQESGENIIGYINIYECLSRPEDFSDLRVCLKNLAKIEERTTVSDAINVLKKENAKIAAVVRNYYGGRQRVLGIVTMKDLVEELVGELSAW